MQSVKYPILRARWRVNEHGDPNFLLHFLMFISWMLITPSFKKKLDSRTISREFP